MANFRSLKRIKALLIDLNGTIHVGHDPTPRAVAAVARLRQARIPFIFWRATSHRRHYTADSSSSNNTKESTADVVERLTGMGVSVQSKDVITSIGACRRLVDDRQLKPFLLLSPSAKREFSHLPKYEADECDSVILGQHPPSLSYDMLNTAFRILKGEPLTDQPRNPPPSKPVLIAPHTGSFLQASATSDVPAGLSLGIGPFVKALESAACTKAEIVGKPTKAYFEMAVGQMKTLYPDFEGVASDCAVVGDDVENDLGEGAMELAMTRILDSSSGRGMADGQ